MPDAMISVRALDAATDTRGRRSRFRSGNSDLDRFFETRADKNQGLYCATYVAVDGDDIVGYVSVAATSVKRVAVAAAAGPRSWPALLLGRMAVSDREFGQRVRRSDPADRIAGHSDRLGVPVRLI